MVFKEIKSIYEKLEGLQKRIFPGVTTFRGVDPKSLNRGSLEGLAILNNITNMKTSLQNQTQTEANTYRNNLQFTFNMRFEAENTVALQSVLTFMSVMKSQKVAEILREGKALSLIDMNQTSLIDHEKPTLKEGVHLDLTFACIFDVEVNLGGEDGLVKDIEYEIHS